MAISPKCLWCIFLSESHVLLLSQQTTPVYSQFEQIRLCVDQMDALNCCLVSPDKEESALLARAAEFSLSAVRCCAEPCSLADALDGCCLRCASCLTGLRLPVLFLCTAVAVLVMCKLTTFC